MLFKQFGWTAVIAVLSSLLVARLLTPMMAAYLLKPQPSRETPDGWIMTRYLATIRWCLGHRRATIAVATAFLVRSEEHTSELQSLMRTSSAVFCLKKTTNKQPIKVNRQTYCTQPVQTN